MERVAFITCESGVDLIVSFAICFPEDPGRIESLTLMRTPKYEAFLYEWERGATVSFERETNEGKEPSLLRQVRFASEEKVVTVTSERLSYTLDVRKVDEKDLKEMRRVLRKMNHDSSITLEGL